MKSREEVEKWMRNEVSNPIIGDLIMRMTEDGLPMDEILEMIKPLVDNTPNVERKLVEDYMKKERIEDGDVITSKIEEFANIAELNGFETIFSVYEVNNINELSGITADYITNGLDATQIELENKELTWLELWAAADNLYKKIGDTEHLFVESFDVIQNGDKTEVQVFFGS
jgi:hypothetical protein